MRNIVQIDFNDMNNCGVLNSASSESSILLCITPEDRQKTSLKVEITGSNGEVLTSPELTAAGGIVRYEADREYWTEAGTMKVRLLSGEGNSGYAEFQIIEKIDEYSGVRVKLRAGIFDICIQNQEEKQDDYVIEKGNDGTWAYRKWKSGLMEAWVTGGNVTETNFPLRFGNVFYEDKTTFATTGKAAQFVEVDHVLGTTIGGGIVWMSASGYSISDGKVTIDFYLASATQNMYEIKTYFEIKGRWK